MQQLSLCLGCTALYCAAIRRLALAGAGRSDI